MKTKILLWSILGLFIISGCNQNTQDAAKTTNNDTIANDAQKSMSIADSASADQSNLFKITIDRKLKRKGCTEGYVLVNDVVIGYTLELPDINNIEYISSIPKGVYAAKIRTDGKKGWRVELIGVPGRTNVQIHIGNYTRDILGCILIGQNINVDNCTVSQSIIGKLQDAFNKFTQDLKLDIANPKTVEISVEIKGV